MAGGFDATMTAMKVILPSVCISVFLDEEALPP
jgi:hypothetical protein